MEQDATQHFTITVASALGADPAALDWPQGIALCGTIPAMLDPQNALLTVYGAAPADFEAPGGLLLPPAADPGLAWCSRVLVLAKPAASEAWLNLGFQTQGSLPGYWSNGSAAELWAAMWGERCGVRTPIDTAPRRASQPAPLSTDWTCRPAEPADARDILALMQAVFPDYRMPDDPGVIRYALASGAVHGRVICDVAGHLLAYASAEFQPGQGAVEITDCATDAAARGHGLMTHLVARLQEDLVDVFDGRSAYALVREDEPAMQKVCENLGWQQTGRLVNHFRVGGQWLSANIWSA